MELRSNNPFRAVLILETSSPSSSSPPPNTATEVSVDPFDIRLPVSEEESVQATESSPVSEKDERAPSPVPEYSRKAPESHLVVRPDIVAQMAVPDDLLDIELPRYPKNTQAFKGLPPDYDDSISSANRIRRAMGLPMLTEFASDSTLPRYEDVTHVRQTTEARRRAIEETNRRRKKLKRATGIWALFRYCIPGRKTEEGAVGVNKASKGTLWGLFLVIALIVIIPVVVIKLATSKGPGNNNDRLPGRLPPQLLEVAGFPPIPSGISVVQPAAPPRKQSTCVSPPALWSCDLPPPATNRVPEFQFEIRYRPSDRQKNGPESVWAPRPPNVPSPKDYQETAMIDSIKSNNTAGIQTEFVLSMLYSDNIKQPVETAEKSLSKRFHQVKHEDYVDEGRERGLAEWQVIKRESISDPSTNSPIMIPKLYRNQPLRLMDQSLPSEHYAAHVYFQKSIYLDSIRFDSEPPQNNNEVEGSSDTAKWACIWSETRFKVQIFTRKSRELVIVDKDRNRYLMDSEFGQSMMNQRDAILPYPVTITEDRIGGSENEFARSLNCYEILKDENGGKRLGKKYSFAEKRDTSKSLDRCLCEWGNWKERGRFDQERKNDDSSF